MQNIRFRIFDYIKPVLLVGYFGLLLPTITTRISDLGDVISQVTYLLLFGGMFLSIIAAAYVQTNVVRIAYAAIFAASAFFFSVYVKSTNQFMTYDAFINMINSAGFIGDAFGQNRSAFLASIMPTVVLFLSVGLKANFKKNPISRVLPFFPVVAVLGLTGILFLRGGDGSRGLPPSFTPIPYALLVGYESITENVGPRQPVSIPLNDKFDGNLVLMVDESISGYYLDINNPNGVPTPLSQKNSNIQIVNYGVAASITTCSIGTNLTLRFGGTRSDYQRINATMPSIWAYAKKAGLMTVYIDAQRTNNALQNKMSEKERQMIDKFIQFPGVAVVNRDMAAADELIRQLDDPTPKFIMMNKMGAHFPVHDKFPDSHLTYKPALPRGKYSDVGDTGDRSGFEGQPEDWERYRNSYRNTLSWNVSSFFDRLFKRGDFSRTTLIYTADHGQNLHENGAPSLSTHCSAVPIPAEGAVPLLLIKGVPKIEKQPSSDHIPNFQSSHYGIFPKLLEIMGYRSSNVRALYGAPIGVSKTDPGTFNARFNARLNRKPVWVALEKERASRVSIPGPDVTKESSLDSN